MQGAGLGVDGPHEAFVGGGVEEDRGVEVARSLRASFGDRCGEVSGWDVAVWWEGDGVYVLMLRGAFAAMTWKVSGVVAVMPLV